MREGLQLNHPMCLVLFLFKSSLMCVILSAVEGYFESTAGSKSMLLVII